ncbi:unnamed protein product [Rhizophagus irregularis]|nr:unnamed protein product [Rhizophagus irregularis]
MYGHTQGEMTAKNIRKTTIYGQGEMINGNSSAKNIREATIYRHVQGEMINRSTSSQSSGHENLNRLHVKDKFTPEVQNQPSNSNFDAHYQNYCRCCNYSPIKKENSEFVLKSMENVRKFSVRPENIRKRAHIATVRLKERKAYIGLKVECIGEKIAMVNLEIFDVPFHKIKLPWE